MQLLSRYLRRQPAPSLSALLQLSGLYVWLAIFVAQPHKEERFLYVVYPLFAYHAALTLRLAWDILDVTVPVCGWPVEHTGAPAPPPPKKKNTPSHTATPTPTHSPFLRSRGQGGRRRSLQTTARRWSTRAVVFGSCATFLVLSTSRIAALYLYYHGSLELYREFAGRRAARAAPPYHARGPPASQEATA